MPAMRQQQLFTAQEVADQVRVHVDTFRRWCRQGKGPRAARLGGTERFELDDVVAWISSRKTDEVA